jgi:RNA polymerase sigma-70 factor (ECF subfamily)
VELQDVYRQELPSVYALLTRLGAPSADLPDLAHDIFVTALRRWSSFDPSRPVRPWVLGITWRVLSDFKAKRRPDVVEDLPEVGDERPDAVEARQTQALVHKALASLDDVKRAAFVLHELEGHTVAEVGEIMGAPLQTTYSRLRVAREEFTAAIRRLERGER